MKKTLYILVLITVAFWFGVAAETKIRLATQVIDQVAAGFIYAGPVSGAAATPTFRAMDPFDISAMPRPNDRRWALAIRNGASSDLIGDVSTASGSFGQNAADSTSPANVQGATTTTDGNVARVNGNLNYVVGRNILFQIINKQSSTITRLDWWGVTDQTAATMAAADDPAGNYAAFRYSSSADSNYKCITKDNTTQNVQDSGVAVDSTAYHEYEIRESAGVNFTFYIDGTLVCTNSTNLPTSGTPLRYIYTVTCVVCAPTAVNIRNGWIYIESDL